MHTALQNLRAKRARREEGFTLIELLVVVVIIGILIAIAIPVYLNYQKGAHNKAAESDLRNAIVVMEQCYSDDGEYPTGTISADASTATPTTSATACGTSPDDRKVQISDGTKLIITSTASGWKGSSEAVTGDKTFYYVSSAGGSVTDKKPAGF